jgi:hypothetical protein
MATRTMGTAGTTTLVAVPWPDLPAGQATAASDFAAISALILDDTPLLWPLGNAGTANGQNATQIAAAQNRNRFGAPSITNNGILYIPNRGYLQLYPGDWIGVDGFGWPILVSGRSIQTSTASWAHSGNPT